MKTQATISKRLLNSTAVYLLTIVLLLLFLASCKKEVQDQRDKAVGDWIGIQSRIIPGTETADTVSCYHSICKGTRETEIIVKWYVDVTATAYMSFNSFSYDKVTQAHQTSCGSQIIYYWGSGYIKGDSLIESGTLKRIYSGVTYNGVWWAKMKRK